MLKIINNMILLSIQPLYVLPIGTVLLLALLWIFWPNHGAMAQIAKYRENNQRVLLEDALKFIFDCEYHKILCSQHKLSDHLNISNEKTTALVQKLTDLNLIGTPTTQSLQLTQTGRSYALRVVRIHRVWERYFADKTSVRPEQWHIAADKIEHRVSLEDTEKIAAQIGNPVFDPHGDPIPTIHGEMPKPHGTLLSNVPQGTVGRIIHIEDEPQSIYEQLLVQGLYPGMQVYVTNVSEKKITFAADGDECALTPLFARNVTIEKLSNEVAQTQKHQLLSELSIGEQAEVIGISSMCRGQQRRRLMDLGILPGSQITAVLKSASGDPTGYRIMGTTIGIRKQHAQFVFIQQKNKPSQ